MIVVIVVIVVRLFVRVRVMLRTVVWKDYFAEVFGRSSLPPCGTVGIGHLIHHSKDSSPEVGPISSKCDLQAGCIYEQSGGTELT